MKKKEMYDFLVDINHFYPNFEVTESKAIAWQSVLYFTNAKDFRYALIRYVKNETYPPSIAGLLEYWRGNDFDKSSDKAGD